MEIIKLLRENQDIINIIFGIGSFVSTIIAIFTLREVVKQRLSTYKPEILIKSFIVSISKSPFFKNEDEIIEYKIMPFNDYSVNSNEVNFSVSKTYKVENLGLGPAKNIKCKWNFDFKQAIKEIEKTMPSNFKFKKYSDLNTYFLNDENNTDFHYSSSTDTYEQRIEFISPINSKEHFNLHSIPEIIIYTHYLYLIFKLNLISLENEIFYTFDFKNFPKPKLKVSYLDMNNKKYKKEFIFDASAVSAQIGERIKMDREFAMLIFKVK